MILVLCGTQKQDFSRMIRAVEELADEHEVIVQGGHNQYESNKVKVLGFISRKEMNELYDQADYIITHAGAGSMIQSLKKEKTTIAVPRLSKYGEHVNDHQIELADKLEKLGYLLVYHDGDQIKEVFNRAKQFKVKPYRLKGELVQLVDETIEAYIR